MIGGAKMETMNETRLIRALEKIANNLEKLTNIIEHEDLYVKGDINVID